MLQVRFIRGDEVFSVFEWESGRLNSHRLDLVMRELYDVATWEPVIGEDEFSVTMARAMIYTDGECRGMIELWRVLTDIKIVYGSHGKCVVNRQMSRYQFNKGGD